MKKIALALAVAGSIGAGVRTLADPALAPLGVLYRATRLGVTVQEYTGIARLAHS